MMLLLLLAEAASSLSGRPPDLVELARIVEPYASCEFSREPEYSKLAADWSVVTRKSYADPKDEAAAKESARLMEQLRVAKLQTETVCGYESTHQKLRDRLVALHPKMDSARAYWLARSVFNNFNNLNEHIVTLKAGVFPPSPSPPSSPTSVPQVKRPNAPDK
jgi:hypothetical protein